MFLKGDFWADINNLNLLCKKDIMTMFANTDSEINISYIRTLGMKSNIVITYEKNK